jgi:AcrR family transcriptional regulator
MALIAVRAGVSVGALYKHYPSRAALIADLYERTAAHELDEIRDAADRIGGSPSARLTQALLTFCDRALRGGRFTYAMMVEPAEADVESRRREYRYRFSAFFAELLREALEQSEIPDQDIELAANGALGAMVEVLVPPLLHGRDTLGDNGVAISEGLVRFILRAVGAEPPTALS